MYTYHTLAEMHSPNLRGCVQEFQADVKAACLIFP